MTRSVDTNRTASGEINSWPDSRLKIRLTTGDVIVGRCEEHAHTATWITVWQNETGTDLPISVRTDAIVSIEPE